MTTTAAAMVAGADARVRSLTPYQVEAHLLAQDCVLVDLREPDELDDEGLIAGAFHVPRGQLEFRADPASPEHRPPLHPDQRTILYCTEGHRSALGTDTLHRLGYRDVAHLAGGLEAWKRAGRPVAGLDYRT
ncbi:rhodanese-like domain-containing protein [Nitriliruptor alkaliphilus]|uniref:rhodanese-like domain-containing protein n=1 Tax=Nitriliruptor alkaliphilus TaxID=427918 RepID=UPI000697BB3D|nr:rhodanese-like domain-containing protein [Nitriliruptor alkaliphilus]